MKAPALTATNDLDLSFPGGSWAEGQSVVAGYVYAELNTFRGEWFYDAAGGFDAVGIGRNRFSAPTLSNELRRCMGRVSGVLRIEDIVSSLNPETRQLQFSMTVVTSEGRITIAGEQQPNAAILATMYSGATIYQMSLLP
jgi:hypothetical protein